VNFPQPGLAGSLLRLLARVEQHFMFLMHSVTRRRRFRAWEHLKAENPDQPITASLGGNLRVRIYPRDVLGRDIFVHGFFEEAECRFVRQFLTPGMTFFDIGANLGQYTLLAAQQVGESGQVHSFEPSGRLFAELIHNVRLNGLENICSLNQLAVSDNDGIAFLSKYCAGAEVYGSLGKHKRSEASVVGEEKVHTTTIDRYVRAQGVKRIDLIKMDIEGAELPALQAATQTLVRADAPAIVFEMGDTNAAGFGYTPMEIWDLLEGHEYRMYEMTRRGTLLPAHRPRSLSVDRNYVALKSSPP